MRFFYTFFIRLYVLGIRIAGNWNKKAREWTEGRKNLFKELSAKIISGEKIIWMHCASAGEFEQGKPLIEALKEKYHDHKILLTIFSPSGFPAAKKFIAADIVSYLPADTPENAKRFLEIVQPQLVVFVKYEFWFHHLSAAAFRHIPILLVSSIFREDQVFFKWYGKFYRQILFLFRQILVQDEHSLNLLKKHEIHHCSIAGDTRFDRVLRIAAKFEPLPEIEKLIDGKKTIIAGSTWKEDETVLTLARKELIKSEWKLLMVPHEIDENHLNELEKLEPEALFFSGKHGNKNMDKAEVIVIDTMGMLSRLYYYASITYIGGGFNKSGIHNTLEAAVFGKPVIFGPHYQKFREARDLIACGGAFSFETEEELKNILGKLINDPSQMKAAGDAAHDYVRNQAGATERIMRYIQENRLLTS